ncbi:MerR family DNA-binding transcriptional regulator [Caballeronia sp. LjRoot31]|jgi:DNA-binding transcriptional MerR regulator
MSATYSIGASSTLCGVNIETIRYYERVRLMPMPARRIQSRFGVAGHV